MQIDVMESINDMETITQGLHYGGEGEEPSNCDRGSSLGASTSGRLWGRRVAGARGLAWVSGRHGLSPPPRTGSPPPTPRPQTLKT